MPLDEGLKGLRQKAGYSREQAAERLDVSRQAVAKWEGIKASHHGEAAQTHYSL